MLGRGYLETMTRLLTSLTKALDSVVGRVEHATALDRAGDVAAQAVARALPDGTVRDVASGTPAGHPLHPVLVTLPIGSWAGATVLDLTHGDAAAARRLVGLGVLGAVPSAVTGANDWLSTTGAERRVGLVHAALNYTGLALYSASWLARRRGHRVRGAALSLAGLSVIGASGWLGGHLSYALGVGVDTTAFQHFPSTWTDVAADADVPSGSAVRADADGVPVLLTRHEGGVIALADRCTHRGGPLHEGTIADGGITCPWHGSTFDISDGSVRSGPASRPQPTLETRVVGGRVEVRHDDPRGMRNRPVGH